MVNKPIPASLVLSEEIRGRELGTLVSQTKAALWDGIYQFGLGASAYLVWLDGRMRFNFGGWSGSGVTEELVFSLR